MKTLKYIIQCSFLLIQGLLFSQATTLKKANKSFESLSYKDAIEKYTDIIKSGNGTIEVYRKIGDAYYFNSHFKHAAKWYERMMIKKKELEMDSINTPDIDVEYYFKAAQSYKHLGNYKKADSLLSKLSESNSTDSRLKKLVDTPFYIDGIALQSGRYTIKKISQNSAYTDFAPSFYKDQLVFSTARKQTKSTRRINQWTKQPYLNLYKYSRIDTSRSSVPREFSKNLNSRLHESTSSFHNDGSIVFFTRNNLLKSRVKKDSIGVSRLKILKASLNSDSEWSNIEELPFNNEHFSVAHPAISYDGRKLFFASDMPGGYGMSDIYVVDILENGSYGVPSNLGPNINTEGRDTFPFISKNNILYFASDGHLGLGGFDVFVVDLKKEKQKVYNVGTPINSTSDDMTFIIDEESRSGFFASNRSGGRGDDDIYGFEEHSSLITECKGGISGIVKEEVSGDPISNGIVLVNDEKNDLIFSVLTDEHGSFSVETDCNHKSYRIFVEKEGYDSNTKTFLLTQESSQVFYIVKMKNKRPQKGVDLAKLLNLEPIYFKSSSSVILDKTTKELDKIVDYMKKNKTISIEVGSHTDSKGSSLYNMKLSERRAAATANYIINNGIDYSRVKNKGYGETTLINECENGVKCSQEKHAQNRRSEFIIIEN
ncbi:OmpA family protein [Aquimarina aggregata]|uniref:OmpA family protein n=1 Tax=Aquimarina aggregata TaxID=1642818 RepID=UPI0024933D75|nr:OmpA family protein [Aquimarina aggregata]